MLPVGDRACNDDAICAVIYREGTCVVEQKYFSVGTVSDDELLSIKFPWFFHFLCGH